MNPFKFGSIVNEPHFTNRVKEINKVLSILKSENHLILMSPRRYGKSSLIFKVVNQLNRPVLAIDLQLVTSTHDLAAQLLKRLYRIYPTERIRQYVKHFRIIPSISLNPVSNSFDVSFNPESSNLTMIEDVLNLMEKLSKIDKKLIVVFDEFQEITSIDASLLKQFRSIMQHHQKINYVFLGSQESMMRDIFEKKASPFYHFGMLMPLHKIPKIDFEKYLVDGFQSITKENNTIAKEILSVTKCHPYYTQQLAYVAWEKANNKKPDHPIVEKAVSEIIRIHDNDYERIWARFNNTDKKMLIGLSQSSAAALSEKFLREYDLGASSTAFSSLNRLMKSGYVIKGNDINEIDDPFFRLWIRGRREA
jgi:hypothetical protein